MEPIDNEELLTLLQNIGNSLQNGIGSQQDIGAKVNMIDGRVDFLNQLVLNQLEQLRKEISVSNTVFMTKITDIDKQVGVLQDNQKRIEDKVFKEEEDIPTKIQDKSPPSLFTTIVTNIINQPTGAGLIVIALATLLAWGTTLIEYYTGEDIEDIYPSTLKDNKPPASK